MSGSPAYFLTTDRLDSAAGRLVACRGVNFTIEIPCVRMSANAANTSVRATRVAHALFLRAASPLLATHGSSENSATTAGCAGLRPYRIEQQIYELGFHLGPEYWRRGLALEAARAVIAYAFEPVGARSLFAGHHPENVASRRVLAKLGFRHTHDELYPPTGLQHPSYLLERA